MSTTQVMGGAKVRWRLHEILSVAMIVFAALTLVVNFLVAVPVSVAAIISSVVGVKTSMHYRNLHIATLVIGLVLLVSSVVMALFLLPAGTPDTGMSGTVVPAN